MKPAFSWQDRVRVREGKEARHDDGVGQSVATTASRRRCPASTRSVHHLATGRSTPYPESCPQAGSGSSVPCGSKLSNSRKKKSENRFRGRPTDFYLGQLEMEEEGKMELGIELSSSRSYLSASIRTRSLRVGTVNWLGERGAGEAEIIAWPVRPSVRPSLRE